MLGLRPRLGLRLELELRLAAQPVPSLLAPPLWGLLGPLQLTVELQGGAGAGSAAGAEARSGHLR